MKMQTEGFVALGEMPNDDRYPCLICKQVPDSVVVDLFIPEPKDIPPTMPLPGTLAVTYRLCPRCHKAKPEPWKIRLLVLERLRRMMQ